MRGESRHHHRVRAEWAEGHGANRTRVAAEGQQFLAALRIPHLRRTIGAGCGMAFGIGAKGHTVDRERVAARRNPRLRIQNRLMQSLFRCGHRRLPESKRCVDRLHAQKDALLRILAETFSRERPQIPGFGLALVSLSCVGLLFGHVPLDKGIDCQSQRKQERNGNGSDDDSLRLSCRLAARQDVLRLQSCRLGIFFGAPLRRQRNVFPVDPSVTFLVGEGVAKLADEILVLAGIGCEDLSNGVRSSHISLLLRPTYYCVFSCFFSIIFLLWLAILAFFATTNQSTYNVELRG